MTYYGAKKIIAWHLANSVGLRGVTTVEQLESWVQEVHGQRRVEVDRRLRELRDCGWVINSHLSEKELLSTQYRLVRIGDRVWER